MAYLRKGNRWFIYTPILCTILLFGCGDSIQLNTQQKQGMKLYNALCDRCHKRIEPTAKTDQEWKTAVMRYGVKLQLQPQELDAIVAYLTIANDTI